MLKRFGDYEISDDKKRLNLDEIHRLLQQSYWAHGRSRDTIIRSIENSRCFGVYDKDERQLAFARVITDGATLFYLCDVIVHENHRGAGIGKRMIEAIVSSEELHGLSGQLATDDAHGLYERYGFRREPDRFMRRPPDSPSPSTNT